MYEDCHQVGTAHLSFRGNSDHKTMRMFTLLKKPFYSAKIFLRNAFAVVDLVAFCIPVIMLSCDSENDQTAPIDYISTEEEAKEVLKVAYYFWEYSLKDDIHRKVSGPGPTVAFDYEFEDNLTRARCTGSVTSSSDGAWEQYSSWSSSSKTIDANSEFSQDNSYNEIKFNGTLTYHDFDASSSVCTYCFTCVPSGMVCSGNSNSSFTINTVGRLNVEFEYKGKKIKDNLTLTATYDDINWDATLKNKKGIELKVTSIW